MHGRAMQALVVVLDEDLPVRRELGDGSMARPQLVHPPALVLQRFVGLPFEGLAQVRAWLAEVREHEALPYLHRHRPEAERCPVELVLADERRPDQPAVVGVAPRVVGALDRALRVAVGLRVAEPRAAMPADVVEPAQLAVRAADEEQALAPDVDGDEVPRLGRLAAARDVHPFTEEDPLALELEHLRSVVIAAWQGGADAARAHARARVYKLLDTSCYLSLHCAIRPKEIQVHPREHRSSRRQFLFTSAGAAVALSGADALLRAADALGSSVGVPIGPGGIPLARRNHPVTLPSLLGQLSDRVGQEQAKRAR